MLDSSFLSMSTATILLSLLAIFPFLIKSSSFGSEHKRMKRYSWSMSSEKWSEIAEKEWMEIKLNTLRNKRTGNFFNQGKRGFSFSLINEYTWITSGLTACVLPPQFLLRDSLSGRTYRARLVFCSNFFLDIWLFSEICLNSFSADAYCKNFPLQSTVL